MKKALIAHLPSLMFWGLVVLIVFAIELLVRARVLSPAVYATPTETLRGVVTLFREMDFAHDLIRTTQRTLWSLVIGYPLGILIALQLYTLGRARASGELVLDFFRSIPLTSLIPIFLVVFGAIGDQSKIAIGAASAMTVTAVTMWISIRGTLRRFHHLIYLYQPSFAKRILLIILPHARGAMATSLRLSVSSSLVLVLVAEMFIGTQDGVGRVINDSQYRSDRGIQWGAVAIAGVLGYVLNRLADLIPLIGHFGLAAVRNWHHHRAGDTTSEEGTKTASAKAR